MLAESWLPPTASLQRHGHIYTSSSWGTTSLRPDAAGLDRAKGRSASTASQTHS